MHAMGPGGSPTTPRKRGASGSSAATVPSPPRARAPSKVSLLSVAAPTQVVASPLLAARLAVCDGTAFLSPPQLDSKSGSGGAPSALLPGSAAEAAPERDAPAAAESAAVGTTYADAAAAAAAAEAVTAAAAASIAATAVFADAAVREAERVASAVAIATADCTAGGGGGSDSGPAAAAILAGGAAAAPASPSLLRAAARPAHARLASKEWAVLRKATLSGRLRSGSGLTTLPEGWVKEFGDDGGARFVHAATGRVEDSVEAVVAEETLATSKGGGGV